MKTHIVSCVAVLVLLFANVFGDTGDKAGEQINWQVISGGGDNGASTTVYRLSGTVGQTSVGAGTTTLYGLNHGYWQKIKTSSTCCTGPSVGNVDGSSDNLVTMGDLTVLIDHLFISLTPLTCVEEGNVDLSADGLVTMGDLTILIDHLFISLSPLPPCP